MGRCQVSSGSSLGRQRHGLKKINRHGNGPPPAYGDALLASLAAIKALTGTVYSSRRARVSERLEKSRMHQTIPCHPREDDEAGCDAWRSWQSRHGQDGRRQGAGDRHILPGWRCTGAASACATGTKGACQAPRCRGHVRRPGTVLPKMRLVAALMPDGQAGAVGHAPWKAPAALIMAFFKRCNNLDVARNMCGP